MNVNYSTQMALLFNLNNKIMTQLKDNLIAIVVPIAKEDRYFVLWDDPDWIIECQLEDGSVSIVRDFGDIDNDYYIIGSVEKDGTLDFDCSDYVTCLGADPMNDLALLWSDGEQAYFSSKDAFISLLNNKGISLEELNNQKVLILEIIRK
jgi:hypothetical protein